MTEIADIIDTHLLMVARSAVWGAVGAGFGYTFALVTGQDPILGAKVFAIGALANAIFSNLVEYGYQGVYREDGSEAQRNRIYLIWTSFAGVAALVNLNHLGFLSKAVSIALGVGLAVANSVFTYYHQNNQYFYVNGYNSLGNCGNYE